jgi:aspartate racemase
MQYHGRIGVVGGLGPYATARLELLLLQEAKARGAVHDRDFPPMTIAMECQTPDRTAALLHGGADPLPALAAGLARLSDCSHIIVPCNTAHAWLPQLRALTSNTILDMLHETVCCVEQLAKTQGRGRWLLLATDGTLQTGLYQQRFAHSEVSLLAPEVGSPEQKAVMTAIYGKYDIKAGYALAERHHMPVVDGQPIPSPTDLLDQVIEHFMDDGLDGVILGCTEIPLAINNSVSPVPTIDPMHCVAKKALACVL